jgi:hypothetical protein
MVKDLIKVCGEVGLQINESKTKYMSNRANENLKVEGMEIERVVEYTYLGRLISFQEGLNKEIQARKRKAWSGYWSLKQIFKGNVQIKSKTKILDSCVMPILAYGAQTWSLT